MEKASFEKCSIFVVNCPSSNHFNMLLPLQRISGLAKVLLAKILPWSMISTVETLNSKESDILKE